MRASVEAWRRWQAAAGPWQGWSICPTLLSPGAAALPRVQPHRDPRTKQLATAIRPWLERGGTLCVLDLDPVLGVAIAARVADVAHPVLVLPRWPYAEAILPTESLLAILLAESRTLPRVDRLASVLFVLDADRSRPVPRRKLSDSRADNRVAPASFELPDLKTLRARDIRRIHHVRHA